MFKQLKYNLVYKDRAQEIKIAPVEKLWLNEMGAYKAEIHIPEEKDLITVNVDWINTFIQEFTGQFDSKGVGLYFGDIFKVKKDVINEFKERTDIDDEIYFQIGFVNGSFVGHCLRYAVFVSLNMDIAKQSEKAGTVYQNPELVEVKIDETVFQNKEEENGEQKENNQA